MRILLVNIEGTESAPLRKLLGSGGSEVVATWSGVEALREASESPFDLMLVSHYVPDLYVGDLLDRASRLDFPPTCFVLSNAGNENDGARLLKSEAGCLVTDALQEGFDQADAPQYSFTE